MFYQQKQVVERVKAEIPLVPMIFETSRQARFLIPMALSLGFGVLFSTVVTLLLVPSLYRIVEDLREWGGARVWIPYEGHPES